MGSRYESIADEKSDDLRASISGSLGSTLLDEEDTCSTDSRIRISTVWMLLINAVLLMLSLGLFTSAHYTRISTMRHVQQFSAYSPAVKAVQYQSVKFNDTMGEHSPFVGKGPEIDKAWHAISYDIGDQMITPEELGRIDMPKSSLKVKHPDTGVEGYRVGLEVFHQLHCINLLRQVTYKEYYTEVGNGNFANGEEELQIHTDHCLEILRLNVQCNADIGVFTFYMLEDDPLPWPELNSWHTCRNFDAVRDWALENSVGNMERPDVHPN